MNQKLVVLALAATALAGAACNKQSNTDATETVVEEVAPEVFPTAQLRVVHAAQATGADFVLDGVIVADDTAAGSTTDFATVNAGEFDWAVTTASGATTIASGDVTLAENGVYTVVIVGGGETFSAVVLQKPELTFADDTAYVSFVNASVDAGALDFLADGRQYAAGVAFGTSSNYVNLPAGGYTFEFGGATSAASFAAGHSFVAVAHGAAGALQLLILND